jgi:hypothetical protein
MATVEDHLRRLSEMDTIYLGWTLGYNLLEGFTVWHEGRLQQSNDGSWLFRSSSSDGSIVAFQLSVNPQGWKSTDTPREGIEVSFPCLTGGTTRVGFVHLRQQLPQPVTN